MGKLDKYYNNRWIIKNPKILYRLLRGFFRAKVLNKNTLRVIELFPTFKCQSSCEFCSVGKYSDNGNKIMELSDYSNLAKNGAKMGATVVTILGGEPLLYNDLNKLISIFKQNGYYTHIVSNGLALTKESLISLKKSGLDCIYFSLESIDPEKNDPIRGQGHCAKIMQNLQWAKELHVETGLSTVMMADAMSQAIDVIDFCHKNNINASGGQIAPVGRAENYDTLSEAEFKKVRELISKYPRLTFDWVFSYFLKPRCPAGKEKIGVTCYGDVIGCSYNPLGFGNIYDEDLNRIWERMGNFSQFRKDFSGCLSSEDPEYISTYLSPIIDCPYYPLSYLDHPKITPQTEPDLFRRGA